MAQCHLGWLGSCKVQYFCLDSGGKQMLDSRPAWEERVWWPCRPHTVRSECQKRLSYYMECVFAFACQVWHRMLQYFSLESPCPQPDDSKIWFVDAMAYTGSDKVQGERSLIIPTIWSICRLRKTVSSTTLHMLLQPWSTRSSLKPSFGWSPVRGPWGSCCCIRVSLTRFPEE